MNAKDTKDSGSTVDVKLQAFNAVAAALTPLSRADQYAVLHAAAQFFGCALKGDLA